MRTSRYTLGSTPRRLDPKIRRTLARLGRLDRAIYVERGSTKAAVTLRLADKTDDDAPYFAIVLVPGWSGAPKTCPE